LHSTVAAVDYPDGHTPTVTEFQGRWVTEAVLVGQYGYKVGKTDADAWVVFKFHLTKKEDARLTFHFNITDAALPLAVVAATDAHRTTKEDLH
jgi:hypothetical protein